MRSYALAVAVSVLLAAVYAFQNSGEVTVRFFIWTREVPQGIWEAAIFAGGCVLMWFVSISAWLELRGTYKRQVKEQEARIQKLEEERLSILRAIHGEQEGESQRRPAEPPRQEIQKKEEPGGGTL